MNSKTRYYADAYGPDTKALAECIRKAFELADSDDEVERVVLYSYTKNNFMQVDKIFGADNVTQMFSCPMKFNECAKPINVQQKLHIKKNASIEIPQKMS